MMTNLREKYSHAHAAARLSVLLLAPFVIVGCQAVGKNFYADEIVASPTWPDYVTNGKVDLGKVDLASFDGSSKQEARRKLGMVMLDLSDRACTAHKATIYSNSAMTNVVTGVTSLLLSGYASVAENAKLASQLAAGSTAVAGAQGQWNQEIYQTKVGTAIARAIDVLRERELSNVQIVFDRADASVADLVVAINRYHHKCSLLDGVAELTRAVDNQKPSVQEARSVYARLQTDIRHLEGLKEASDIAKINLEKAKIEAEGADSGAVKHSAASIRVLELEAKRVEFSAEQFDMLKKLRIKLIELQ